MDDDTSAHAQDSHTGRPSGILNPDSPDRIIPLEARLKLTEKKMHARRIFVIRNMLDKVGLLQADDQALYGAFLTVREGMEDIETQRKWAEAGAQAIEEEKQDAQRGHEAVILTFLNPPTPEAAAQLRASGFRFNKILRHWEGVAEF